MLAGSSGRQPQNRRQQTLDSGLDPLVLLEERLNLVALGLEKAREPLVFTCVIAFLSEEAADLLDQLGVVLDLIEVVTNASDEEPLANRKEQVQRIRQVSRCPVPSEPVARCRTEGKTNVSNTHHVGPRTAG